MGPNKQQHNKNMLRYKTETRPGLVTVYDIWPGNEAGLCLQPRSPHVATRRSSYGVPFLSLTASLMIEPWRSVAEPLVSPLTPHSTTWS